MARRILALVSEPVSGGALEQALGSDEAQDAEVLVVAPALNTRTRFLLSDPDPAIERAEEVQEETVERMTEQGVDAAGDTGESDPMQAIEDTLQTFEADEIVLFIHPEGERNWLEDGLVDEAKQRFERPVRHVLIES
jgi:GABA permease